MSTADLPDERLREELAGVSEVAGDGKDCPSPETLWLSGRDELDSAENEEVVLHMAECTACASAWKLARELAPAAEVTPFRVAPRKPTRTRWSRLAAAAVIVMAVSASAVLFWPPERDDAPVYREQNEYRLDSVMAEETPLAREQFTLSWSPGPEGTIYEVLITDERLETLHRAYSLDQPRYQVPEAALARLKSGERVFWQVIAQLPDGRWVVSDSYSSIVE
jgi:hypothetical protein